jgi:hypothetical protein
MALFRPRLTDHFGIYLAQAELDFAIPFLDEDIPLYLDPFLLWSSPSQQDQSLHTGLLNAFNHLGRLAQQNKERQAISTLVIASECKEVGMGSSATRKGKRIGEAKAAEIIDIFKRIPQYGQSGFRHFEEIQLFVDGISRDRISDISCSFLKSFLVDFTQQQCQRYGIPMQTSNVDIYDYRSNVFELKQVLLPSTPVDNSPVILVPKRWLEAVRDTAQVERRFSA